MDNIIITFGIPRSGTTFMEHVFSHYNYKSFMGLKIQESNILHPYNSDRGMDYIEQLFQGKNILFICTLRNPIEIANSFYAAKQSNYKNQGLKKASDEYIINVIKKTYDNTRKQQGKHNILYVKYENIANQKQKQIILQYLVKNGITDQNEIKIVNEKLNNFGKNDKIVREGRLQFNEQSKSFISEKLTTKIKTELSYIFTNLNY